jgi:colanic acid/amylovoran biosynthesis protein
LDKNIGGIVLRIGLLGFTFNNPNKGCEALTYSVIGLLQSILPNEKLTIINFSKGEEGIGEVPQFFRQIDFEDIRIRLKRPKQAISTFKKCDFIFDITYGDNFSDIYSPRFVFETTLAKKLVIMSGTPLILMPQTYGPFSNKFLKHFAMHVIKKSYKVYSRDEFSTQYLKGITPKKEVKTYTDLALTLPFEPISIGHDKLNFGLNVSGLLWKGGFHQQNQFGLTVDYKKYIHAVVKEQLEKGHSVHIIPHVTDVDQNNDDDDVGAGKIIKEEFAEVELMPSFSNPFEIKNYIAAMDVFSGARMHSTIDAFSSGVATIPFSYSRKFEGLYHKYNYPYIVNGCSDTTEEAIQKTNQWIEEYQHLKAEVAEKQQVMQNILKQFNAELTEALRL